MDWIQAIRRCFDTDSVLYSNHARREMRTEAYGEINEQEVYEAILSGEVIEAYRDDTPYPSVLLFGTTRGNRPLHVVCAYNEEEPAVIIITVYQPDSRLWDGYRRRKP